MEKIDFVIIWVDPNDPEWQKEKSKYDSSKGDSRKMRYRDWNNLQYIFRGIEKFTPWVNNVYFVTWGHLPKWLNINHPKLKIVNHKDYIPKKYLPTFSANPIELNLHRIKGLSEKFVYFNDDMFILKKMNEEDFFKNNLPCDIAALNAPISIRKYKTHVDINDMEVINDYFDKNTVIKKNFFKWFNPKYGPNIIKTLCLMPWGAFTGLTHQHLPTSFLKSTFEELWDKEYATLDTTCNRKFREILDVNQWLMEGWQIASGKFSPRSYKIGKSFEFSSDSKKNIKNMKELKKNKYKLVALNDIIESDEDFDRVSKIVNNYLNDILPEKSSFEL